MCKYLVRNTNGGILGGYDEFRQAVRCKEYFERVYGRSHLVSGVKVEIWKVDGDKKAVA